MARLHPKIISSIIFLAVFIFSNVTVYGKSQNFSRILLPKAIGLKEEKITHLHFYFHDIVSGPNPTAIRVAEAPTKNLSSSTGFGAVVMIDDPLTERPEMTSKHVGRAQGLYALASKEEAVLLMTMSFAFTEGKYNGSMLSILGRNRVFSEVREMPVVGGSGLFRFARGYAKAKTYSFNLKTGDAVVEYNVYVTHY